MRDEEAAVAEDARATEYEPDALTVGRGFDYARGMVQHHRRIADSHRAAARALRDEEAITCGGLRVETASWTYVPGVSVVAVDSIRESLLPPGSRTSRGYFPL